MNRTDMERLRTRARRRRDCEREILFWSQQLHQQPGDAEAYYHRGNAFRRKGQLIAALSDFNAALRLNSWMAEVYFYKAIVCAALGYRLEEMIAYRRFLELTVDQRDTLLDGVRRRLDQLERPS